MAHLQCLIILVGVRRLELRVLRLYLGILGLHSGELRLNGLILSILDLQGGRWTDLYV